MNKFQFFILNLNKYKFVRQIKWILALFMLLIMKIMRFLKLEKFHKKNKRLFITTGNISLINALVVIEQLKETNCEDYLIIESFKGGYDFWNQNLSLAKMHNFKKIKLISRIRYDIELKLTGWFHFDEIFLLNHSTLLPPTLELYKNTKISFIDEGYGSLVKLDGKEIQIDNFNHFYSNKYIDKIDWFGLPKYITDKIVPTDINIFRSFTKKLSEKYPVKINCNKEEKDILFCGIYWECSGLDEEKYIKEQQRQINNLIDAGYHILYKPHPRETNFYGFKDNKNITFIDSALPVEIYNLDILAVVAMSCTTLINLPNYYNVPSFSNVLDDSIDINKSTLQTNIIRLINREYSPNYRALLGLPVKTMSKEELKKEIKIMYENYIKDKPLLSQNKIIEEYAKQYAK